MKTTLLYVKLEHFLFSGLFSSQNVAVLILICDTQRLLHSHVHGVSVLETPRLRLMHADLLRLRLNTYAHEVMHTFEMFAMHILMSRTLERCVLHKAAFYLHFFDLHA